jgi:hypothetical protein
LQYAVGEVFTAIPLKSTVRLSTVSTLLLLTRHPALLTATALTCARWSLPMV